MPRMSALSGGNLGMVLRSPSDEAGGYFAQSFGQYGMNKEFIRLEIRPAAQPHQILDFGIELLRREIPRRRL